MREKELWKRRGEREREEKDVEKRRKKILCGRKALKRVVEVREGGS